MLSEIRVKDTYLGRGRVEVLDKMPDRQGGTVKIVQTSINEIFQRHHGIEIARESFNFFGSRLLKPTIQAFAQLLENFLPTRFDRHVLHPSPRLPGPFPATDKIVCFCHLSPAYFSIATYPIILPAFSWSMLLVHQDRTPYSLTNTRLRNTQADQTVFLSSSTPHSQ